MILLAGGQHHGVDALHGGEPAVASQDVRAQFAAERKQISEILAIGDQFARFNGVAIAKEGIEKGQTIDQVRGLIMNAMTAAQTTQAKD